MFLLPFSNYSDVALVFQTAPCLQAGSGWWDAEALAQNSPSWWPSSGRVRSRVGHHEPSSHILARRNPNTTSRSPASIVRFQAPTLCGITTLNLMLLLETLWNYLLISLFPNFWCPVSLSSKWVIRLTKCFFFLVQIGVLPTAEVSRVKNTNSTSASVTSDGRLAHSLVSLFKLDENGLKHHIYLWEIWEIKSFHFSNIKIKGPNFHLLNYTYYLRKIFIIHFETCLSVCCFWTTGTNWRNH